MVEYLKWSSSPRYLPSESAIALRSVTPHACLLSSLQFTVKPRWPKTDGVVDVPITFSNSEPNLCCLITFVSSEERGYIILGLYCYLQYIGNLSKDFPNYCTDLLWKSDLVDESKVTVAMKHYWESIWDNQDVKHRSCDKWKRMGYT